MMTGAMGPMMSPCKRGKNRCGASGIDGLVAAISFRAARCLDCRDGQEPGDELCNRFCPGYVALA
jgi:hypothetical protein